MPLGCRILVQEHMLQRGNFALNKVPVSKILVCRREGYPSYSFFIIIIYFLKMGKSLFLGDLLDLRFGCRGEGGAVDTVVAQFSALETKTLFKANLLFLWGELLDAYGIDVHCIWVLGFLSGGWKVGTYRRGVGDFVVFAST